MAFLKRLVVFPTALAVLSLAIPLSAAPKVGEGERVKQVEAKYVCFITKQRFDTPQLPVLVDGKTYYGCCQTCMQQLMNDPTNRVDVDPVSGKEVDKATAVIGVDKAGKAYFFESMENLKKFRLPATQ